ncbi:MAG: hypothetical protein IT425_03360 [Pirellulales bacterium]|nr:hypothetical protein [Pirellulales bacterium]
MKHCLLSIAWLLAGLLPALAQAATITLDAVQDTTLNSTSSTTRNTTNDDTDLLTWNKSSSNRRESVFQFDLTSLGSDIIVAAHLEYYDLGTGGAQTTAFANDTYLVYPDAGATAAQLVYLNTGGGTAFDEFGMHEEQLTYNSYAAATGGGATEYWTEAGASSLDLSLAASNAADMYYAGGSADASTLTQLNDAKDDFGYVVVLSWYKTGSRTFDDLEGGHAPRLVVETIPEPSTAGVLLLASVLGALASARRKS